MFRIVPFTLQIFITTYYVQNPGPCSAKCTKMNTRVFTTPKLNAEILIHTVIDKNVMQMLMWQNYLVTWKSNVLCPVRLC